MGRQWGLQVKTVEIVGDDRDPLIINNGSSRDFQRGPVVGINLHIIRMILRCVSGGIGVIVRGVGTVSVTSLQHRLSCLTTESIARTTKIVAKIVY